MKYVDFKRFMKWQSDKTNHLTHKYILHIQIQHISKLINTHDEYAAFWCEISTEKGFIKSELIQVQKFQGHKFTFPLEAPLDKDVILRLYICKGLKDNFIGQIQFRRPEIGIPAEDEYKSVDKQL